jgi:uncharacterized membrane protein
MTANIIYWYIGYYFVMLAAVIIEVNTAGNRWSPALFLTILTMHFLFGLWEARKKKSLLMERYIPFTKRSLLAIATDALLICALVVGSFWMDAALHAASTDDLFIVTLVTACVGNTGCVLLHKYEIKPT